MKGDLLKYKRANVRHHHEIPAPPMFVPVRKVGSVVQRLTV